MLRKYLCEQCQPELVEGDFCFQKGFDKLNQTSIFKLFA